MHTAPRKIPGCFFMLLSLKAGAHRDLHGFEGIFFPTETGDDLEIHKVFLRSSPLPVNKNLTFKTAKHSKVRDFSARQGKTHGKAD